MLKQRILLCVTGGIAAYKAIDLASRLHKAGYQIRTILSEDALHFVSKINFEAITHSSVHTSLWEDEDPIPHISLADWADLIVVAPATANTIAKAAHGLADNLLTATLLAHTKPILWIPAMNVNMYHNSITQTNMDLLKERGHYLLDPSVGMLACAYEGKGKYPPNAEILYAIRTYLTHSRDLIGKKVMVTAGATIEHIDPMRMITNRSSGKMGISLARALALRGAEVTLVYGSVSEEIPNYLAETIYTPSVDEMHDAVIREAKTKDWIIMCAAVSDFKPALPQTKKIKKSEELDLNLVSTPDILFELGANKKASQLLIGFAAETQDIVEYAKQKLKKKNLDLIVANSLENAGKETNSIILIDSSGELAKLEGNKFDLAHQIIDTVINI